MWFLAKFNSLRKWISGLSKEEKKKLLSYAAVALLIGLYVYQSWQHEQLESKFRDTQQALQSAETAKDRLEQSAVIEEKLRVDLQKKLSNRDEQLSEVKETLNAELSDLQEEYAELLATYNPDNLALLEDSDNSVNEQQTQGACYAQVESIARRAASVANERMWTFYRNEVRDGTDRPEG